MGLTLKLNPSGRIAVACCIAAIAAFPASADYETGMNYFKAGKYVEAAAEFQQVVADSPNYDFGYYILGHSFLKMNKTTDSIESFRKAVELNGDKFEYRHGLAMAYATAGNQRKALETLNGADSLAVDANQKAALYQLRGATNYQLKQWPEAIADLEKIAGTKKSDAVYSQLGSAYYEMNHYDKAADAFEKSLAIKPSPETQQLLALALMNAAAQGDDAGKKRLYDEALAAAKKYEASAPSDFEAINLVGRCSLGAGDFAQSIAAFDRVLKLKPNYCPAIANKGKAQIAMSKWADAEASFRAVEKCDPKMTALAEENLGFVLRKQGKKEDALAAYEKAQTLKPSPSIAKAIEEIKYNIDVDQHNIAADETEKAAAAAAAAEAARIAEEERKRKEWEKKHKDD